MAELPPHPKLSIEGPLTVTQQWDNSVYANHMFPLTDSNLNPNTKSKAMASY